MITEVLRATLAWLLFWFVPIAALAAIACVVATIPARRREQARMFLDLVLLAVKDGKSAEETIVSASQSREATLGPRFHLLAAYIESGLNLPDALRKVRGFIPPEIAGMIRAGFESKVPAEALVAAKRALGSRMGGSGSEMHYSVVLVVLVMPFALLFLPFWRTFIFPKMRQIMADMDVPPSALSIFVAEYGGWIVLGYAAVTLLVCWFILFYLMPASFGGFQPFRDRLALLLPWSRRRQQRDFSLMLALLLDAGVPEKRALDLAGEATGNDLLWIRARTLARKLAEGLSLPEALGAFDRSGEFGWRLANALQMRRGFVEALRGWHQALESEAAQKEEAAAHTISSGLLIFNGVLVGGILVAVFQTFTNVIDTLVLW